MGNNIGPMPQRFETIRWRKTVPYWGDVIVWVSVARLDRAWLPDARERIGPHRRFPANGSAHKYDRVEEWLIRWDRPMHMPHVGPANGGVSFSDGRHRFAWMRDHGVKYLPVTTSRSERLVLTKLCGTLKRESTLPLPVRVRWPARSGSGR
jgi:hypothetical protein